MGSNALRKGTLSRGAPVWSQAAPARIEAGRRAVRALACAGAVGALCACGSQAPDCHSERCEPKTAQVMTWWATSGSSPGASLQQAAREQQPGVEVTLMEESATKDQMMARLQGILNGTDRSAHVDAFLTHPGPDLLRWTPCGGNGPARVRQLNGADGYADLSARFDPRVLQGLQCCPSGTPCAAPEIYGVPLGLHQVNHIISNKARFARCPGRVVTNLDSLIELLSCLGADGQRVISIPVTEVQHCELTDSSTCWKNQDVAGQSLQYLLESLSLLVRAPSGPRSPWSGRCWEQDSVRALARLGEAREALDRLRPYLNNGSPGLFKPWPVDFEEALKQVGEGDAAFLVAPDWTQLTKPGLSQQADRSGFPGTEGTFLFTTDAFALPSLPDAAGEAGLRWIDTLLQPEVQARFAVINGAHPALVDPSELPPLLPSLEIQSPAIIDSWEMRKRLNEWAQGGFSGPPPDLADLMEDALGAASEKGLLPASAPDNPACDAP